MWGARKARARAVGVGLLLALTSSDRLVAEVRAPERIRLCEAVSSDGPSASGSPAIRIFGANADRDAVAAYFRAHPLAVSRVRLPPARNAEGWTVELDYPSLNFAGENGGSTVMYSHTGRLVASDAEARALARIDRAAILFVFAVDGLDYTWVGCAGVGDGPGLDWFEGRTALLFRQEGDGS